MNPGTAGERRLKSKGLDVLQAGDLVSLRMPGAGGYGDPRERSLDAIERDLLDGKVGIEAAQSQYGVIVDRETLRVERRGYGCRPGQASPANGVPADLVGGVPRPGSREPGPSNPRLE